MFLKKELLTQCKKGVKAIFGVEVSEEQIRLQATNPEFLGTHTLVAFGLTKLLKKAPQELAKMLGQWLADEVTWIDTYEVVGGFLNLVLSDASWLEGLKSMPQRTSAVEAFKEKKVLLEISCPNTNKPLHLGHLRNVFLGIAVANILEAVGAEVIRVQHINDRGIHICKSMVAYNRFGEGRSPQDESIKEDHFVGKYYVAFDQAYRKEVGQLTDELGDESRAKKEAPILKEAEQMLRQWEEGEESVLALWKKMNGWVYDGFEATYDFLGVSFDKTYYESETYLLGKEIVERGLNKRLFYRKDDRSIWVDLEAEGFNQKLLLRGDGTAVYITQDLGTADLRYEDFGFDQAIYVVGNEQEHHFGVLFAVLKKLGRPYAEKLYHLAYGMVDLPSGKMKSREGKVVDADDLIKEMVDLARERTEGLGKVDQLSIEEQEKLAYSIGLGALKYFLLRVGVAKRILFDPERSVDFQGDTAPFVQYTYARIVALLRKSKIDALSIGSDQPLENIERELVQQLVGFREVLCQAACAYNPALLVEYLHHLAKLYNRFYAELPVLKAGDEDVRVRRLYFSQETGRVIKKGMQLLGIEVPDRM